MTQQPERNRQATRFLQELVRKLRDPGEQLLREYVTKRTKESEKSS